jgi:cysteine desulfurase / selenocysteine lyase
VSIDLTRARAETPGCKNVLHFNNAGAALMPQCVIDAVQRHLTLESEIGGYEAFERALQRTEDFYDAAGQMLGCRADEIAFIENATRAWDMAFYSIPFQRGDRILTAQAEYASNYISFLQVCRKTGASVEPIPSDQSGSVSIDALSNLIDDRVRLIAITHVPTNGGLINPAAEIGKIAKEARIPFLLDACQSVGQMPIDVDEIGCDVLSATGRKFLRGPRATGLLYVRKSLIEKLEPPFLDLHAATWVSKDRFEMRHDARRFENWEQNYAGKIGLAIAIRYALQWGLADIQQRVAGLAEKLRRQLSGIGGVQVRDLGVEKSGIVTFTVEGKDVEAIKRSLSAKDINVTTSYRASTLLDMEARGLSAMIRASVHYYNSEEEVDRFCDEIRSLAG